MTTKWSDIKRAKVPDAAAEAALAESARALRDAIALATLRQARGVTQVELASRLDIRQSTLSAIENRRDVYLSTLRDYVAALGGSLELSAVFDGERVDLAIGDPT